MQKIIHFTIPEHISPAQSDIIECARKYHPSWEIKIWQDPIQEEDGFLLEHYWPKANSGAQLADLVRLDVLHKYGGVYVDSDLRLLKPLDSLVESFDFFIASEDGQCLTNALIGARKESQIIRFLIDILRNHEPDWTLPPNITTGPEFFSQHLKWKAEVTVLPREFSILTIGITSVQKQYIDVLTASIYGPALGGLMHMSNRKTVLHLLRHHLCSEGHGSPPRTILFGDLTSGTDF